MAGKAKAMKREEGMVEHCENCWWFSAPPRPAALGDCQLAGSYLGAPDNPDSPMVAQDYEGYAASLTVRPTFGCVAWRAK